MGALITFIHVIACIFLATIILMQSGRGGGLTEGFAQAGEMFGAKTNEFLIKTTTILSVVFFVTCISLAVLSAQRGKSLMTRPQPVRAQSTVPAATEEIPAATQPQAAPATAPDAAQ